MFVKQKTYELLAAQYGTLKEHRDKISSEYTDLKEEYQSLERQFNAMEARYDTAAIEHSFVLECFEWVEDAPLWLRGTKTPDLRKRREDLRTQARKLGILVDEETPAEEQEEQSA